MNDRSKAAKARWRNVPRAERSKLMRAAARARWGPPKKPRRKSAAAVALAARRWSKTTAEQRQKIMRLVRRGPAKPKPTK